MLRTYLYLLLVVTTMISGCSNKDKTLEPTWGKYQEPVQPKFLPEDSGVQEIDVVWRAYVGAISEHGFSVIKPNYSKGFLYVVNRNGDMHLYDAASGKQKTVYYFGKPVYAGVGIGEGLAVVGHDDGSVTAMDVETGKIRWRSNIKRQISAIPVVANGRVIVRGAGGLILGLEVANGTTVWRIDKETSGFSVYGTAPPVITGDAVLTGLSNGNLLANNIINGKEYWEAELSVNFGSNEIDKLSDSDTPAIVIGRSVYTGTYNGDVVSLDLFNGQNIWRTDISTRLSMAYSDNSLVVVSDLGVINLLNLSDGRVQWQNFVLSGHGVSPPAIIGNRVLVGDANGNIHTFSLQDGTLIQSRKLVAGAILDIIVRQNNAWVFSSEGRIAAISLP